VFVVRMLGKEMALKPRRGLLGFLEFWWRIIKLQHLIQVWGGHCQRTRQCNCLRCLGPYRHLTLTFIPLLHFLVFLGILHTWSHLIFTNLWGRALQPTSIWSFYPKIKATVYKLNNVNNNINYNKWSHLLSSIKLCSQVHLAFARNSVFHLFI
jgi:hypothetical protein